MTAFSSLLKIDTKSAAERLQECIRELVDTNSASGVILGLSGGVDSAVLATLAVGAVGPERVDTYYLYDRDSGKQSHIRARLMADWLNVGLKLHDIEPHMRRNRVYSPAIMRLMGLSGFLNRHLNTRFHRFFHDELPFISTLHKGNCDGNKVKKFLYDHTIRHIEQSFNARHIYRRRFLEQKAEGENHLILGAANRSECMVGWFVKDGIDDMPLSPISGLYKTQVHQLAGFLDLPLPILNQKSSPDMLKGVTDECAMGINYADLDIVLHGIDHDMSDDEIINFGVTLPQICHVRRMNELSSWKRTAETENND